jgi:hypothetical protein
MRRVDSFVREKNRIPKNLLSAEGADVVVAISFVVLYLYSTVHPGDRGRVFWRGGIFGYSAFCELVGCKSNRRSLVAIC